jgi:hypothetical protein
VLADSGLSQMQGSGGFGDGADPIDGHEAPVPFEVCHKLIYGYA